MAVASGIDESVAASRRRGTADLGSLARVGLLQTPTTADVAVVASREALRLDGMDGLRDGCRDDVGGTGHLLAAACRHARRGLRVGGVAGCGVHHLLQRALELLQPRRRPAARIQRKCSVGLAGIQDTAVAMVGHARVRHRSRRARQVPGHRHVVQPDGLRCPPAGLARSAPPTGPPADGPDRPDHVCTAHRVAAITRLRPCGLCAALVAGSKRCADGSRHRVDSLADRPTVQPRAARPAPAVLGCATGPRGVLAPRQATGNHRPVANSRGRCCWPGALFP